jgi:hypothetical protein
MKTIKWSLFILGFSMTSYGQSLHLRMYDNTDKYFSLSAIRNFTVNENSMNIKLKDGNIAEYALNTIKFFNYDLNALAVEPRVTDSQQNIHIYPNPTNEEITVSMASSIDKTYVITIFQSTGEEVFRKEIVSINKGIFSEKISLREFNSGVYFVQIQDQKSLVTKKIIKN